MYLIICSWTTRHFGLLKDLENNENVLLFVAGRKKVSGFRRFLSRIHFSKRINGLISLPFKDIWYKSPFEGVDISNIEKVIIIDSALAYLNIRELYKYKKKLNVDFDLQLINSLDASSLIVKKIRKTVFDFPWSHVFTFDSVEAEKYNFLYRGFCYYSMICPKDIKKTEWDVYFIGGTKGNREQMIYETFDYLCNHNIQSKFQLSIIGNSEIKHDNNSIEYIPKGWIPYEDVVENVLKSNCIIEILQENQNGPSLRYFEAVCYNKKLLTTNPNIIHYPYYDSRYMKYFNDVGQIDINWIKSDNDLVDYDYKGEFSPVHLLD